MGLLESRAKIKIRDAKRETSFDGGSSKDRLEIQEKTTLKKMVSNQGNSNLPKARDYIFSNPKLKKGRDTSSPSKKPSCRKCCKKHYCYCLNGMHYCFACGKSGTRF